MRAIGLVYDNMYLAHVTPPGHPEKPDRLRWILRHLEDCGMLKTLHRIAVHPAPQESLLEIHSLPHVNSIRAACEEGGGVLDAGDTHVSTESYNAAVLAAGGVCAAIDAVFAGEVEAAFCAVRPPGHHAEREVPMGFCLFNNVAIGARYAQRRRGAGRVAIVDWDVHHGNGTQHSFEDDPSVLYISLHQFPFYPGTGARGETGVGAGEGYTLNIPLPSGTGEEEYLSRFREEVVPALHEFKPDLLIISAGFDAHGDDPLADMKLTEDSFAEMTSLLNGIAPIVSVLEGGYHPGGLARSVERHLEALRGA